MVDPIILENCRQRVGNLYRRAGREPPKAKAVALRLLEEAIELCLATGATAGEAQAHVADALHSEAKKHGVFPSELNVAPDGDAREIAGEVADVMLLADLTREAASVSDGDVQARMLFKVDRLERAQADNRLVLTADGRFYRTDSRG